MKRSRFILLILALIACSQPLHATTTPVDLGTAAPPSTLGGYAMTPFGPDPQPVGGLVMSVASPLGGAVTFSDSAFHYVIGNGWATWSHGYTGDVYNNPDITSITLSMPANTGAFYFYAEPDPFGMFEFTVMDSTGATITATVEGNSGANGFGFYTTPGQSLVSLQISSSVDFGFGEFGIASAVPEPSTLALLGLAAVGSGVLVYRRRKR